MIQRSPIKRFWWHDTCIRVHLRIGILRFVPQLPVDIYTHFDVQGMLWFGWLKRSSIKRFWWHDTCIRVHLRIGIFCFVPQLPVDIYTHFDVQGMLWFGWLKASLIIFRILIVFITYSPPPKKNPHPLCIASIIFPKTRGTPYYFQNFDSFYP